ncbi:MAG: monovalent cation/H+ antiporter complex subunit F [Rhizobiaceae bacterium]|nr:monovalent cation/H+ antiporter complex subunit F [Rhizobiaceae bacterium]
MAEFLLSVAVFLLVVVGAGLLRLLRGPSAADRIMAVQMLGTGGGAICLLLAVATRNSAIFDVALTLGLLAVSAVAALSLAEHSRTGGESDDHAG